MRTEATFKRIEEQPDGRVMVVSVGELDERWTALLGRKVWRNINTGQTWLEEK